MRGLEEGHGLGQKDLDTLESLRNQIEQGTLDSKKQDEFVKVLNDLEDVSFLLAEQNTNIALRYANYGYVLENGRVVMDGEATELRENEDVKEFYLGVGGEGRKNFRDVKNYRRRKRWL